MAIKYSEPTSYFPASIRKEFEKPSKKATTKKTAAKKTTKKK